MSVIIDTNIWTSLLGLFTVLLSSWCLQTHLPPCRILRYTGTSCLSYNEWVISVQILLLMIYITTFMLTSGWLWKRKQYFVTDMTAEGFIMCSSPWNLLCGFGILNAEKGKTACKRLSQSHGVTLQPFIIPMNQTLLVYNGLHEVVDIVIIIIFLYWKLVKLQEKKLCF